MGVSPVAPESTQGQSRAPPPHQSPWWEKSKCLGLSVSSPPPSPHRHRYQSRDKESQPPKATLSLARRRVTLEPYILSPRVPASCPPAASYSPPPLSPGRQSPLKRITASSPRRDHPCHQELEREHCKRSDIPPQRALCFAQHIASDGRNSTPCTWAQCQAETPNFSLRKNTAGGLTGVRQNQRSACR